MAQNTKPPMGSGKSAGDTKKADNKMKAAPADAQEPQAMGEELHEFFMDAIKDIYWAEKSLTKALPKMAKAATTDELQQAFEEHLTQTEEHVSRLEQVFDLLGEKAEAKKCEAMAGLQKEAEQIIEETTDGTLTRDVALIMAAQKVEHYEIATYGGLATLAGTYGLTEVADLFQQTLDEEKQTDENLTFIAENNLNHDAGAEGEETEEEEEDDEEVEEDDEKA